MSAKSPQNNKFKGGFNMPKDSGIDASPKRREDIRFLTGTGQYTGDINIHGQAHVYFLRSDMAHGKINSIETAAAAAMPGVVRIFTVADFEGIGSIPWVGRSPTNTATPCRNPPTPFWHRARCAMWATRLLRSWPKRWNRPAMPQRRLIWTLLNYRT